MSEKTQAVLKKSSFFSAAGVYRCALFLFMVSVLNTRAQSLQGPVIDESGNPQSGVIIKIFPPDSTYLIFVDTTDSNGMFDIGSIGSGDYQINLVSEFFPEQWFSPYGNTIYRQFYTYLPSAQNFKIVKSPKENPPISAIKITVLDSLGLPYNGGYTNVSLKRYQDGRIIRQVSITESNLVVFGDLSPASYAIGIYSDPYPFQWYDSILNSSMLVYHKLMEDTMDIIFNLTMLPKGDGHINGYCQTEDGLPAAGVTVSLYKEADTSKAVYTRYTSSDGMFRFDYIQQGNYYLKASLQGYPDQWFSRFHNKMVTIPDGVVSTISSANEVICYLSLTTNPFVNSAEGEISVILRDSLFNRYEGNAQVELIRTDLEKPLLLDFDDVTKVFVKDGIMAGRYELRINAEGYQTQYYSPDGNTEYSAYTFELNNSEILAIEVILTNKLIKPQTGYYGYLAGTLTGEDGALGDALIKIFNDTGMVMQLSSDASGGFFAQLSGQSYYYLSIEPKNYPFKYWSQNGIKLDRLSQCGFYLARGDTINFSIFLEKDSTDQNTNHFMISGCVRDELTQKPISGCRVLLLPHQEFPNNYNLMNLWSQSSTFTDDAGKYSFEGVPVNQYVIAAESEINNYVSQFYPGVNHPSQATLVNISAVTTVGSIDFKLRKGGILKGLVKDNSGKPLHDVSVHIHQTNFSNRYYQVQSLADGSFEIQGVSSGVWRIDASHPQYMQVYGENYEYKVTEGSIEQVKPITLEPGGRFSGPFYCDPQDRDIFEKIKQGRFFLFNDFNADNQIILKPVFSTEAVISLMANNDSGIIHSGICKTGDWNVIFSPGPQGLQSNITETTNFIPGLGWSIQGIAYKVVPFDTVKNIPFELRKGYSVFGRILHKSSIFAGNFNVDVYVKSGDKYIQVTGSYRIKPGFFELPGLIPGDKYFLKVWADGFSPQFWSPAGNSLEPDQPYIFDTSTFVALNINLDEKLNSGDNPSDIPITLWQEKQPDGKYVMKWMVHQSYKIDTFYVYTFDADYIPLLLGKSVARNASVYSYHDDRVLESSTGYIILGKGSAHTVRSNMLFLNPGSFTVSPYQVWLNVTSKRNQIVIEWGSGDSLRFSETDSVSLFRRENGGSWILQKKKPSVERWFVDWQWDRADSGKVFEYKIELKSGSLISVSGSIRIDNVLLSPLSNSITVGAYEKYKTIQQAIDNAQNFDNIFVQSGTYTERLNFKGKVLFIHGKWDFGRPPVIDASGDTAITIPSVTSNSGREFSRIEGFKIQNAVTGIMTRSNVEIHNCLFVNVSRAIFAENDSIRLAEALVNNPIFPNGITANAFQCTFIGRSKGDVIAAVAGHDQLSYGSNTNRTAVGEAFVKPLALWYSDINISRSIIYQYFTRSLHNYIPVLYSGNSSLITIDNCNMWESSIQSGTPQVRLLNSKNINPAFVDTVNYYLPDNSALVTEKIGYGLRSNDKVSDHPSAINNLQIRILSMNSIGLKWDQPPVSEKIAGYKIYRIPGDSALFYLNQAMEWDLKIPIESIEKRVTLFTTIKTYYIDTSIVCGKPYIYVVTAIDSNGNDSPVRLSASSINEFMVNLHTCTIKLSGEKWYMISPWGQNSIKAPSNATVYHWDDKSIGNSLFSQYVQTSQLSPAEGYWVKSMTDAELEIPAGTDLSVLRQNQDSLKCRMIKGATGWNQFGSPFPFPVYPDWLSSIAVWEWNSDSMGYSRACSLKPWTAYWAYVEKDTSLLLLNKTWPPSVPATRLAKRALEICWELNLSLKGKSAWDNENRIGVTSAMLSKSGVFNSPEPPLAFGTSQLFFLKSSDTERDQKLSDFYKDASEKSNEWMVGITASDYESNIEVQGIDKLPDGMHVFWVNGNIVQDLRECNRIAIEPHKNTVYGYVLATTDQSKIVLYKKSFSLRSPFPNPFRAIARIEYVIPYQFMENGMKRDANGTPVKLTVYNLSGQKVKTLVNGIVTPGFHYTVWDGTGDNMQKVSAGFYIVRLQSPAFVKAVKLFKMH